MIQGWPTSLSWSPHPQGPWAAANPYRGLSKKIHNTSLCIVLCKLTKHSCVRIQQMLALTPQEGADADWRGSWCRAGGGRGRPSCHTLATSPLPQGTAPSPHRGQLSSLVVSVLPKNDVLHSGSVILVPNPCGWMSRDRPNTRTLSPHFYQVSHLLCSWETAPL